MPFDLRAFAAVRGGVIVRFMDTAEEAHEGEVALPVVADADPVLGECERLWGPDYEVMGDHVRAYGRAVSLEPEELLDYRLTKLEALVASLMAGK